MVKHFLTGTDQEVKIGNKIRVKVPMKTPYGEGNCEVEALVTQTSLEQLCKDGLVEKKEIPDPGMPKLPTNFADYKPFIRRLARRMEVSFSDAADFLDIIKQTSLHAHNCLLIDLMADVMGRDKKFDKWVYIVNLGAGKPVEMVSNKNIDLPKFATYEDARKAALLIMPFIIAERHARKQKD